MRDRTLLGVVGIVVVLGTSVGTTGAAEAASGLPGVTSGSTAHHGPSADRAKLTKKGIPHRVSRSGLPG